MKLIVKFFCALFVLGFCGLFVLKKPDGTPWLSLNDFMPNVSLQEIKSTVTTSIPEQVIGGSDNEQIQVYKWRDAEGDWQYSDQPPTDIQAEQVMIGTDVNRDLVPARASTGSASGGKAILIRDSSISAPTTLGPGNVSTLIDDAKGVQELMNERQQQLDSSSLLSHKLKQKRLKSQQVGTMDARKTLQNQEI